MATSASTKKAAKLAQKGKGQRVRFQGGTLFTIVVAIIVVLGIGLVVYARQSRPAAVKWMDRMWRLPLLPQNT